MKHLALVLLLILSACHAASSPDPTPVVESQGQAMPNQNPDDKVVKTDAEWRAVLTPGTYRIMRQQGTEAAFSGEYWDNHDKGVYVCAACGNPLFSSDSKFESGTGWPSFTAPLTPTSVDAKSDTSLFMSRTEIVCHKCGGHLGHVFDDGPAPTGQRFCMNSGALKLQKK